MSKSNEKTKSKDLGGWAFYPFLVLIGIVVLKIIVNIITGTPQTGNSFPVTAVALIAALSSFFFGRGKASDRFDAFTKGMASPSAMMMIIIMMFAGSFTSVSSAMGGVESLTNFCLNFVPKNMLYAGILFATAVVSTSIGTSVGSATAMCPIAAGLAIQAGLDLPLAISAVVGGAALGDNLSFVSDTTIAATRGVGCEMKDKFRFNIKIVLPAFVAAVIIYGILGISGTGAAPEIGSFNVIKMLPYFYIIIAAACGMNIMIVLASGLFISGAIGIAYGDLTVMSFMSNIGSGMSKMANTVFAAIIAKGIMGVVEYNGGIEWLINRLTKNIKTAHGAQYSISALSFCMGALIRSTSAIVVTAPLAKDIGDTYGVDPRRTASLMDIFATAQNGFVFWAGLTMDAAGLVDGVDSLSLAKFAIYPALVIIMALISIKFDLFAGKTKKAGKTAVGE